MRAHVWQCEFWDDRWCASSMANVSFSNSWEIIVLLIFHFEKTKLPVRLQLSYILWITQAVHIVNVVWFSSTLHMTGCAQYDDKTGMLCYWITYQQVELYLITSFTYHHWPFRSPTSAAHDTGALEISNCRLVSSCIGLYFKHWLAPYYMNISIT